MKNYFWHIKIPTFLGIILLGVLLGVTVFILKSTSIQRLRASFPNSPVEIEISNISGSSITVTYTTNEPTTGVISYGDSSDAGTIVNDDKDTQGDPKAYKIHYFTIKNLKPNTTYYFNILSNNTLFNDNGSPYTTKTAAFVVPATQPSRPIRGKVIMPDGNPPNEAVAYIKAQNSQLLSIPVSKNGEYSFDLKSLLNADLNGIAMLADKDVLTLSFRGDGNTAQASVLLKDAEAVPVITLNQEYNFTAEVSVTPISSQSARPTIPQFSNPKLSDKLGILIPEENQPFSDPQPEFSGTGIPGDLINITIQAIEKISADAVVDSNGLWKFRPDQKLEPGVYTLTVTGKDKNGRTQSVSESFVMYAEGSQFTDPSVAPTKQPTPTLNPTMTPTSIPLASPSATVAPTITTPSPTIPTQTPAPSISAINSPSPQPSISPPGSNELFISIGLITFATVISAMLFLLFRV